MSKLKFLRDLQYLTQQELSVKSGISARTIQRIETGKEPRSRTNPFVWLEAVITILEN